MLGYFFNALALERRKEFHISAARLQLDDLQRFGGVGFVELVGFGQQHQEFQPVFHARADNVEQHFVQFGQAQARVAQQDDGFQVVAGLQVIAHDLLPAIFGFLGHGSVAVARQVSQHRVGHALLAE